MQPEKIVEKLTSKIFMNRYEDAIRNHEKFKQATIIRRDDETICVITKEKYVFLVKEHKVEYLGKQGETQPPDLQEGDIEFIITPNEWTKQM